LLFEHFDYQINQSQISKWPFVIEYWLQKPHAQMIFPLICL